MNFNPLNFYSSSPSPSSPTHGPTPLICTIGGIIICIAASWNLQHMFRAPPDAKSRHHLMSLDAYSKWQLSLTAGFLFTSSLVWFLFGFENIKGTNRKIFDEPSEFFSGLSIMGLAVSGFLLGFGSRLLRGGLDTYGFYGVPRLSKRAIATVLLIFGTGKLTYSLNNRYILFKNDDLITILPMFDKKMMMMFLSISLFVFCIIQKKDRFFRLCKSFIIGSLLALGMMASGLPHRSKMIKFLAFESSWDPYLIYIAIGAFICSLVLFNLVMKNFTLAKQNFLSKNIDTKLVIGSVLYGVGLGISGFTPGTAFLLSPVYFPQIFIFFLPIVALGNALADPLINSILPPIKI